MHQLVDGALISTSFEGTHGGFSIAAVYGSLLLGAAIISLWS